MNHHLRSAQVWHVFSRDFSFTCTPTRSSTITMNHFCLCLLSSYCVSYTSELWAVSQWADARSTCGSLPCSRVVFAMWCTQRKVEAVLNLCPPTWDSLGFHSTLVRPVTSQVTTVRRYTNWIIIQGGCIKRWSTSDVCLSRTLDPSRE